MFLARKLKLVFVSLKLRLITLLKGGYISSGVRLDISSLSDISVGRNVRVMPGGYISVARGAVLKLEDNVWIGPGVIIYCEREITLGSGTRVAHYSSILDHNYVVQGQGVKFNGEKDASPVSIGKNVWVGANSVLLKGAKVGDGAVIGACSFINKPVPANTVAFTKKELLLKKIR